MANLRTRIGNANALLVFESAARHLSFTRAAGELGISQPAVTRQVKAVEADLGRPLFVRHHNRLALTEAGRRLWHSAADGFRDMAATLDAIRNAGASRRLVVASHSGFAQQWLMPRFSELCAALDDVEVRLMVSDSVAELDRGGYDFAVRVGRDEPWTRRNAHRLIPEIVFPVAAPAFLDAHPGYRDAAPADLLAAALLHMDEGDQPWMTWRDWFRAQGVEAAPPRPEVLYTNYPLVMQEAAAGRGVALAWRPLTDAAVAQSTLVPVGPAVENPAVGYYLAWPADGAAAERAAALCHWFDARISGG